MQAARMLREWADLATEASSSLIAAALLLLSLSFALAQSSPTPSSAEFDLYPMQELPDGFLTNVKNFDDPLCLTWGNDCDRCDRDRNKLEDVSCTYKEPGCHRKYVDCLTPNFDLIMKFCARFSAHGNFYTRDLSSKVTPNAGRFPSTALVTCLQFKRPATYPSKSR
jgi:hypothetical protein